MVGYIETNECRSRFINNYFGDNKAVDCGVCDNCLKKKAKSLSQDEFEYISNQIIHLVKGKPLSIDSLLVQLSKVNKEKIWMVLTFLQSEKKIRKNNKGILEII